MARHAPGADTDRFLRLNPRSVLEGGALTPSLPVKLSGGWRGLLSRFPGN